MVEINKIIDLSGRFMAAFGFISANIAGILKTDPKMNFTGTTMLDDPNTGFDAIGLMNDNHVFKFAYAPINDDNPDVFASPPMLSWSREKRLIVTPITDSDFEVVERYNTQAWELTLRGLIIDTDKHIFPMEKYRDLNEIFEHNGSWKIVGDMIQALGVNSIYFKKINIDFIEGFPDTVAYTFTARSIKSAEYQLILQQ